MRRHAIAYRIFFLLCIGLCASWYLSRLSYWDKLDDKTNQEFAEKARQLEIIGKSKAYIIAHFGKPLYIRQHENAEIFVYIPGPKWYLWPSECKIRIDIKSGLVTHWAINSD